MDEEEIKEFLRSKNLNFFQIHKKADNQIMLIDEFLKICLNPSINLRYAAKEALNIIEKIKIQ